VDPQPQPNRPPAPTNGGSAWSEARAVFLKDLRSELRTKAALSTILLFAVVTLFIVNVTVPHNAPGMRQSGEDAPTRTALLAALLWIIQFFSAMVGLPRTFVKEEEMRTASALRLTARPSAVLAGKMLFNGALVAAVAATLLPFFLILFTPRVQGWPAFLGYWFVGSLGMAGSATLLGAIVARAGGKTYLMLPLAFPILLPILVLSINGTTAAMRGEGGNQIIALVSYVVAMLTLSALLFEKVWSDA